MHAKCMAWMNNKSRMGNKGKTWAQRQGYAWAIKQRHGQ